MSASEGTEQGQSTGPISVAELLARNGTIGSPPVGGHRRRRRGRSAEVTVAELTGEIPVIREPIAEQVAEEVVEQDEAPAAEPVEAVEAPVEPVETPLGPVRPLRAVG